MSVMFMLLQKLTFDGKFQICQILLLPTDSFLIRPYLMNLNGKYTEQPVEINTIFGEGARRYCFQRSFMSLLRDALTELLTIKMEMVAGCRIHFAEEYT
jgi:hypothetical protein